MEIDDSAGEPAADAGTVPPRALIVSIYGLYGREVGGWLSVATLIRLMERLGVDEQAVRSSISRLKRRGLIESERVDGAAGYGLSRAARQMLELGDRRIFGRRRAETDDGWLLVVFSVPESERNKRHLLRKSLTWLGFGTVGPGVWIAPGHLADDTRDALRREGLDEYVDLFRSDYGGFRDVRTEVASWWDLDQLAELYRGFDRVHAPLLEAWRQRRGKDDNGAAFADYLRTLTVWRRLPYLDPGLPAELLPRDWAGTSATETFTALKRRLEEPAHRFVEAVRGG